MCILAIVADCSRNAERFLSRMATTVIGAWDQMLKDM